MIRTVPGLDLDGSIRDTLTRGVLWPSWVVTAALVVPFLFGVTVPPVVQYVPLVASVLVLGLPHGAIDHLALPRVRGDDPTLRAIAGVFALYGVLGVAYAAVWFFLPAAAFVFFILLTWAHWGQGDLYALLAVADVDYLDTRLRRALAVVVRGGLPMLVPLVFFPGWYRRVADALVSLFALASTAQLEWAFQFETRLVLGAVYGLVVFGYLTMGYLGSTVGRSTWAVDAAETLLLITFFAVVPPVLAVGVYFCVWHAYRHIARLLPLEPNSRAALDDHRLRPALARFAREATPLTLASIVLLAGFSLLVPNPPADLLGWIGLYLVLIAVLTLPHVAVVTLMDREQGVWTTGR
ncbi:beta-carotene 15,15'-monooxygenase [Halorientalis pallida]|uniref:Probable beta-carotene 15,15'-dioxygenase n=2 Tax=Halorientalis pallida TaxID=2479928 RepID=A0A498KRQ3_9EURY|nr:beta-carotene 15,15'-monooxygenase [Halorientalis pallida]